MPIIDYDDISAILTLRYNPNKPPARPPLTARDFRPSKINAEQAESQVVKIIEQDLGKGLSKNASILLSGGVDSVLTLAMLKSCRPDLRLSCISMGFGDGDDEITPAKEASGLFNCDFYSICKPDILQDLPKLISIVKEPRWNLYQYYPLELASTKSKTVFTGDGGDELFGGYTFRYQKYLSLLSTNNWKDKVKLYLACHERDWVPDQDKLFGPKVRFSWGKTYRSLGKSFVNRLGPLDQVFLADFNGKLLHDWLPVNAAFARFLDVRTRSVFLSNAMVRFAAHVPWQLKYDLQTAGGKLPLLSVLRKKGIDVDPVKKGFSVNTLTLWKKSAKEIVGRYVNSESEVVKAGIISSEWVSKTWSRLDEPDVRYINKMLGILALEIWWRLFVSRTIKPAEKL